MGSPRSSSSVQQLSMPGTPVADPMLRVQQIDSAPGVPSADALLRSIAALAQPVGTPQQGARTSAGATASAPGFASPQQGPRAGALSAQRQNLSTSSLLRTPQRKAPSGTGSKEDLLIRQEEKHNNPGFLQLDF